MSGDDSRWRPNPAPPSVVSPPVIAAPTDDEQDDATASIVGLRLGAPEDAAPEFDDLFRDHYERLVRSLTVVSGDRERAADAVQEAFVKAHLRWRRVGRLDDPAGWVRRVAINRLRDDHRRDGRKQRALDRLAARTPTHHDPEEPDEIGRLLAQLPRQQRLTTALYYVGGLSVAEIADTLELAEGSVKSHLHDARRRLRAVLDQEGNS